MNKKVAICVERGGRCYIQKDINLQLLQAEIAGKKDHKISLLSFFLYQDCLYFFNNRKEIWLLASNETVIFTHIYPQAA